MKAARLVVLTVAIAAGGVAAMLAGRSEKPPEVKITPAPQIATVDVLVAKSDISMGQAVSPGDVHWQEWPASAATGNFIRKTDRPNAIESLAGSIARAIHSSLANRSARPSWSTPKAPASWPRSCRPACARYPRRFRRKPAPAASSCRTIMSTSFSRAATATPTKRPAATRTAAKSSSPISACWRSTRMSQEKDGQKVVVGKTATLELTPSQTETLVLSQQLGTLSLALRSITDAEHEPRQSDRPIERTPRRREHRPFWRKHDDGTEMIERGDIRGHGDNDFNPRCRAGGTRSRRRLCAVGAAIGGRQTQRR